MRTYSIWYRDTSRGRQYRIRYKWLGLFWRWHQLGGMEWSYVFSTMRLEEAREQLADLQESEEFEQSLANTSWNPL